jgi:hypothetical protein
MVDALVDQPSDTPVSEHYDIVAAKGTSVRVAKKFLLGDTSMATFSVKFDLHDKYIAAGC